MKGRVSARAEEMTTDTRSAEERRQLGADVERISGIIVLVGKVRLEGALARGRRVGWWRNG